MNMISRGLDLAKAMIVKGQSARRIFVLVPGKLA
jgi:hypothetical protein